VPTQRRLIIDTDAKNEADDQFAIVHGLLSESLDVRGIVPAHFGTERTDRSLAESRAEVDLLLELMGLTNEVVVADGAAAALPDGQTPVDSAGARLIIEESKLASTDDPLFVTFLGPLTDMASAILLDPEIVDRDVIVVWIGGMGYGVDWNYPAVEFNLRNDIPAANLVFDSGITLWQVPATVYSMVSVGYAELEEKIRGTSALADYLIDQLVEWNGRLARDLPGPEPSRRCVPNHPGSALRPRRRLPARLRTPHPRVRDRRHPIPPRGHVRQDPSFRPAAGRAVCLKG
jgi:purine nucleosidase